MGMDRSYIEKEAQQYYKNSARVESRGLKKLWQTKKHLQTHSPTGLRLNDLTWEVAKMSDGEVLWMPYAPFANEKKRLQKTISLG